MEDQRMCMKQCSTDDLYEAVISFCSSLQTSFILEHWKLLSSSITANNSILRSVQGPLFNPNALNILDELGNASHYRSFKLCSYWQRTAQRRDSTPIWKQGLKKLICSSEALLCQMEQV
ncbi:uncharacterized protein LOC129305246 isoform X2 [Prosopis cineraria]|uniref:uncharacterized protein LOC129305246 isoform X2 n=1 Tax=Prosopis cineraria TaxID=364024 RepID=UPI00241044CB|nr:uncharacterized protein LOC129305246 isoform X2 [Prosopis cineraria]